MCKITFLKHNFKISDSTTKYYVLFTELTSCLYLFILPVPAVDPSKFSSYITVKLTRTKKYCLKLHCRNENNYEDCVDLFARQFQLLSCIYVQQCHN